MILFSLEGCKVAKPSKTTPQDTTTVQIDSVYQIDSVEIEVHRLLKDTVVIIGVGDIMMGTNYPDPKYLPPDSGKFLLKGEELPRNVTIPTSVIYSGRPHLLDQTWSKLALIW